MRLIIEMFRRIDFCNETNARNLLEKHMHVGTAFDGRVGADVRQHRKIPREHDGVAVGGLVDDEEFLSGNGLAVPNGRTPREIRLASVAREHPIFIALPAAFEIAEKELQSAEI